MITHQPGRFALLRDGEERGELVYASDGARMVITHTEVDPSLRGQGLAKELVEAAVDWARAQGLKVEPRCSYARAVIVRSPSLRDTLSG